ncbi:MULTISPECIES: amidase family protein [unclassified Flavobacterium]|uniref:amidase family protein n=1 Tax=unclassified Flavobacterium TaxID=196869 RepID=UPI0012928EAA|nr:MULTISPECIES: amidase family protein [unclassified Flavobacterium]MQP52608.1 amidase [Flavobacterium sp. LMO9]MQP62678.1 amidase [Flavobacterium sp. LMO6]
MKYSYLIIVFAFFSCSKNSIPNKVWTPYDETSQIENFATNENERMRFKLIQSKNLDKNEIFKSIYNQIGDFSEEDYIELLPYILDKNILSIQNSIDNKKLNYEKLTKWYLYRILKFESDKETFLNAIISINDNAVEEARQCDLKRSQKKIHPIYGMPILLKDNINAEGMPTTAGAVALKNNSSQNAFIVKQLIAKGGIVLGKANLSEWAYFLCDSCPSGYSAIGGQTLNPYGRTIFDTGGSSSGSGVAVAANYAVAAVGSETSGSIISPSSQNSLVGLKPTIGKVSRTGIIPISSTLDTAGPMAKNVVDTAILLSAIMGYDNEDESSVKSSNTNFWSSFSENELKGKRFGIFKSYLDNAVYKQTIENLKLQGAEIIEIESQNVNFSGFVTFLNADMKVDLPKYLKSYSSVYENFKTVDDFVAFNKKDTISRIPYGQALFEGIVAETISEEDFEKLKKTFHTEAVSFFETPIKKHNLDAILSINNYNSGHAAMAKYPCLTVPMGYNDSGEPIGITFITRPFEEDKLLKIGYAFEKLNPIRISPKKYN